jgi:hypothetical protein
MSQLADFFDTMLPFLMGNLDVAGASSRMGESPSGPRRLTYYQVLTRRERASTLHLLYPATRLAANRLRPGLFGEMVQAHLIRNRSSHWEPNHFGAPFPSLLAETCTEEALAVLPELADFEWLKFEVTVARIAPVYVRGYDHDILGFVESAARGGAAELPFKRSIAVAIHRSADQRTTTTTLRTAELIVLARRRGVPVKDNLVTEVEMRDAEKRLIRLGVLSDDSV